MINCIPPKYIDAITYLFWIDLAKEHQVGLRPLKHYPLYASVNWVSISSGNGLPPVRRQAIVVNWTLRNKLQWNLHQNTKISSEENAFENSSAKRSLFCVGNKFYLQVLNAAHLCQQLSGMTLITMPSTKPCPQEKNRVFWHSSSRNVISTHRNSLMEKYTLMWSKFDFHIEIWRTRGFPTLIVLLLCAVFWVARLVPICFLMDGSWPIG